MISGLGQSLDSPDGEIDGDWPAQPCSDGRNPGGFILVFNAESPSSRR